MIGFGWSNKNFSSLDQDPSTLIGNILFGTPLEKEKSSWAIYYNFDQYLYSDPNDPSQGIGIFGRFGISDGKANALHQFYSFGVGGRGIIRGREKDQWGIGYYYLKLSGQFTGDIVQPLGDHDQGGELFYNIAVTPWLHLTPDLQIISRQGKTPTLRSS